MRASTACGRHCRTAGTRGVISPSSRNWRRRRRQRSAARDGSLERHRQRGPLPLRAHSSHQRTARFFTSPAASRQRRFRRRTSSGTRAATKRSKREGGRARSASRGPCCDLPLAPGGAGGCVMASRSTSRTERAVATPTRASSAQVPQRTAEARDDPSPIQCAAAA